MEYKINPALKRTILIKLQAIADVSAAVLCGEIANDLGHGMISDEIASIKKALISLGGPENTEGLNGTLERAQKVRGIRDDVLALTGKRTGNEEAEN